MAALGAKKYKWPLAEIYFKPTTWLKPCSDFIPGVAIVQIEHVFKQTTRSKWQNLYDVNDADLF